MYTIEHDREKLEYEYKGYRFDYMEVEKTVCQDYMDLHKDEDFETFRKGYIEYVLEDMFDNIGYLSILDILDNAPAWFEQLRDNDYFTGDYDDYPTDNQVIDHLQGISFTSGDFVS